MCDRVAPSSVLRCSLESQRVSSRSPSTGPSCPKTRVHSAMDVIPFRVLPSPLDRPTLWPELTSLRSPRPSTASSSEPRIGRADHAPPRFRSQAFSTSQRFTPPHGFAVFFHPAYTHGIFRPLKFLPFEDSSAPLGAGYSPAVTDAPTLLRAFSARHTRFQNHRARTGSFEPPSRAASSPRAPRSRLQVHSMRAFTPSS